MFAIAFDMDIKELRNFYGEPYNNAYYEIKLILRNLLFVTYEPLKLRVGQTLLR